MANWKVDTTYYDPMKKVIAVVIGVIIILVVMYHIDFTRPYIEHLISIVKWLAKSFWEVILSVGRFFEGLRGRLH